MIVLSVSTFCISISAVRHQLSATAVFD